MWKKEVFLSPNLTHFSLDFWNQNIASCFSTSPYSFWRFLSKIAREAESTLSNFYCTTLSLFSRVLFLLNIFPKTFLLKSRDSSLTLINLPKTIVLKIGPDRLVWPVEPGTNQVSGPVTPKKPLHQKTGIELAKSAKSNRFYTLAFFFWKKKYKIIFWSSMVKLTTSLWWKMAKNTFWLAK